MPKIRAIITMSEERTTKYTKFYVTAAERRAVIANVGDAGALLLDLYYETASMKKDTRDHITDAYIANYFGWTERKAKSIRLKLISAGYLYISTMPYPGGGKVIYYFIGKDEVNTHKNKQGNPSD